MLFLHREHHKAYFYVAPKMERERERERDVVNPVELNVRNNLSLPNTFGGNSCP